MPYERRAEYFKHRLTAADGSTEQPLPDSPVLLAHDDNAPRNTARIRPQKLKKATPDINQSTKEPHAMSNQDMNLRPKPWGAR